MSEWVWWAEKNKSWLESSKHITEVHMRKQVTSLLTILAVAGSLSAIAQTGPILRVEVPFSFVAGTKTLPAGEYSFQPSNQDKEVIIRNKTSGDASYVPVLTRLGQRPGGEAEAVFDVAGDQHYLAELHAPGIDAFAFSAAPGKHTHVGVKPKR
jgi:hypothetical protein